MHHTRKANGPVCVANWLATNALPCCCWYGSDEYSMSAMSIPRETIIRSTSHAVAKDLADCALASATAAEVEAIVDEYFVKNRAV